jgi:hypothetical protein
MAASRLDPVPASQRPPVRSRLGPNYDAHSIIHSRQLARHGADVDRATADTADAHQTKREHEQATPKRGYQLCDQDGDRSPSPKGLGPQAFDHRIQIAPFPQCSQLPTNITKYTREMNPAVWLEHFQLACQAEGADDDYFIIQYLPVCVGEYVRAWLEFLPPNNIRSWVELKQVFVENF